MKSSDFGNPPPPPVQPLPPEHPPEVVQAMALERAFAEQLARRKAWATWALVAVCAAAYLVQMYFSGRNDVYGAADLLVQTGADQGLRSLHGQPWRLWSSTFLHGGLLHIGGNMWALLVLGPFLEKAMGSGRFLVLYAVSGLAGALLGSGLHPMQVSVGASGAIWGVMAAAFGLALRPGGILPPFTAHNIKRRIIQPLIINVAISMAPGIDAFAHLGGGVAGFLLVVAGVMGLGARAEWAGQRESVGSKVIWGILAAVLSAGMLASLAVAVVLAFGLRR